MFPEEKFKLLFTNQIEFHNESELNWMKLTANNSSFLVNFDIVRYRLATSLLGNRENNIVKLFN